MSQTQNALLVVRWADGSEQSFDLRPGEAKLLQILRSHRTAQQQAGFSRPGWSRIEAIVREYEQRFALFTSYGALTSTLHRLRQTLGETAPHLLESDRRHGVRLTVDLQTLIGGDEA